MWCLSPHRLSPLGAPDAVPQNEADEEDPSPLHVVYDSKTSLEKLSSTPELMALRNKAQFLMAHCRVSINSVDFNICDAESCHHCTKVRQKWRDVTPDPLPKVPKFLDPVEGSAGLEGHFPTYLESIDACRELPEGIPLAKGESVFVCPLCPCWKTLKHATLKRHMRVVHGRSKRNLSQKPPPKRAKRAKAYRGVDKVVPHKRRGEEESEGEDEAEVEAIVGKAMRDGVVHYVVRWKGYGEGDDTEEPAESLRHCQDLVDAYERENGDETMYEPERIIKSVKRRGKVHYQVRWKGFGAESDTVEPEDNLPPWLLEQFRCDSGVVDI